MIKDPKKKLVNLLTAVASLAVVAVALQAGRIWFGMYHPGVAALLLAAAVVLVPGWLTNKALTRSYRKIDSDASEWGSIFGTLLIFNGIALAGVAVGLLGPTGQLAFQEGLSRSLVAVRLAEAPKEASLAAFPCSRIDSGIVWVHNVGSLERPRVVVRSADGSLKARVVPPRGQSLEARSEALVGPCDPDTGEVMLCPVSEEKGVRQIVKVTWKGGVARFEIHGLDRKASFKDLP